MREFVILEHLSYLIACIADTCNGEAKRQIIQLIHSAENAADIDPEIRERVLGHLREAESELRARRERAAALALWRISRVLWDRLMPAGATGRFEQTPGARLVSITFAPEVQALMDKKHQDR